MREICYKILKDFYQNGTYLNLALKGLDNEKYPVNQIAIRVYGIVQNNEYLDYIIYELVGRKKVDKNVHLILKMQIFEYLFLDKDVHVICDEGVKLAKRYAKSASGFVNVNLRKVANIKGIEPSFVNEEKNISIKYSHPRFITKKIIAQYPDDYLKIMESNCQKKTTFVRKITKGEISSDFVKVEPFDDLYTYNSQAIVRHSDFLEGNIIVQDLGSYLVACLVNPKSDETILDLCAAPGNKTIQIAKDCTHVVANELHSSREKLIKDNIEKFDVNNVTTLNCDATKYHEIKNELIKNDLPQKFDKILIDAPCSGWGVLKSKPEIKYNHNLEDIEKLKRTSRNILENSLNFLKSGGQLIFSTCTINREENDYLIEDFCLENNIRVVQDDELTKFTRSDIKTGICLKNYVYNSDSFYMVKLERNE